MAELKRLVASAAGIVLLGLTCAAEAQNAPPEFKIDPNQYGGGSAPATTPVKPGPQETAAQVFAHQTNRADYFRQSVKEITTMLGNELSSLRPHMRSALVDKDFGGRMDPHFTEAVRGKCPQRIQLSSPCPGCERLSARDFERWFDANVADFNRYTSLAEEDLVAWAAERDKKRREIETRKLTRLEDGAAWLERENALYQEVYFAVAWQANMVWSMYVAEALGLEARHFPGFQAVMQGEPGNLKYPYGVGEFSGVLEQLATEANKAMLPWYVDIANRCDVEETWQNMIHAPNLDARVKAKKRHDQATDRLMASIARCAGAEEAQRDAFAPKFRAARNRLHEAQARIRKRMENWRRMLIASHVYVGEGKEAIASVYGNGQELTLDNNSIGMRIIRWPYSGERGLRKTAGGVGATVPGTPVPGTIDPTGWGGGPAIRCASRDGAVKYPDIEKGPFDFTLGNFGSDWNPSRGTRSSVALGGRMPEEGP